MILNGSEEYKQDVITLWKTAFPKDSEDFVQFYFEKKYSHENTLLHVEDGKILSCLQMLPYKMKYYKSFVNTSYISGAATSPQCRNQGLMHRLLTYALQEMKKKGDILTTLIPQEPWLIDYYKKLGYAPCFEQELTAVNPEDYPSFPDRLRFKEYQISDLKKVYFYHRKILENQNIGIQKSLHDFAVMVEECQRFEGEFYVLIDRGSTAGIGFCFFADDKIILKDFAAKNEYYRQYFLSKLFQKSHRQIVISHSTNGMARILDAHKLLQLFAQTYPHLDFSVKVNDEQIADNNFTFAVANGNIISRLSNTADFELSIGELTQLLLGRTDLLGEKYALFPQQRPYMSLMLE